MSKKNDPPSTLSDEELIKLTGWDPDATDADGNYLELTDNDDDNLKEA